ncbi:hypothetical protein [Actinoplanes utahensis]|uniref:hypothetical protein n=1 Tax=Actinoplanes utahensis TaxID=1869 RepID=UPI00126A0B2B|nr:hypothetical protein [Actinoplanes utahensis]GIF35513.1 hypothetical protein Aut01nite_84990 [Actinoplanes utahensis]
MAETAKVLIQKLQWIRSFWSELRLGDHGDYFAVSSGYAPQAKCAGGYSLRRPTSDPVAGQVIIGDLSPSERTAAGPPG